MQVRFIVRTMTERQANVDLLCEQIPGLIIVKDKTKNAMQTFLEALQATENKPTVMLEDDVVLCKDFTIQSTNYISLYVNKVINFFSMRPKSDFFTRFDNYFSSTLCFYLPDGFAHGIYKHYDKWKVNRYTSTGTDYLVNSYLKSIKEKHLIVIPNLANHMVGKSLINKKRSSKRVSFTFESLQ